MIAQLQSAQESKLAKCKSFLLIVFTSGLQNTRMRMAVILLVCLFGIGLSVSERSESVSRTYRTGT